jgi:cytochrome P450
VPAPSISSRAFWSKPFHERAATWSALRAESPVSYQEKTDFGLTPQARGFWAVTKHADVQHVSRTPEVFCSGRGVGLGDIPVEALELNASFLVMDAPRHTQLRRLVSNAFTPRRVAQLEEAIERQAGTIVDDLLERGSGDVVEHLSMKLPLWTISQIMGIPESMRASFVEAAESQVAAQDPEFSREGTDSLSVLMQATIDLHGMAGELAAARRAEPTDDIFSTLVHAEVDGEPLSDQLLGSIFVLFAVAGNDTTRNSTTHGVRCFAEQPEQWDRLRHDRDLLPGAVEEIIRHASPVIHFRRTTTQEVELGGQVIPEGEAVVLFYESANRDEDVFEDPFRFDIARSPNPQLGFGGGGPHFCLGANLARTQLRAVFGRLAERVESIDAGEPAYLVSNFVNGIKRMPATFTTVRG